jgi:hypothetical protein
MSKNSIIIIIIVIILGFVGYRYYVGTSTDNSSLSVSAEESERAAQSQEGHRILTILHKLEALEINDGILKSPLYINLKDSTENIPVQAIGRPNPFSPLGQTTINNPVAPVPSSAIPKTTPVKKTTPVSQKTTPKPAEVIDEAESGDALFN